jgi:hypothetical protein
MSTGHGNLNQNQILVELMLRALRKNVVILPTLLDLSSRFRKGVTKTDIPNSSGVNVENTPNNGSAITGGGITYAVEQLVLDLKKTAGDYIYDTDDDESLQDLINDFYLEAAPSLIEQMEADAVAAMRTAGLAHANKFQLAGTANQLITLDQIGELNQNMSDAKVSKMDRILAVSTLQARTIRSFSEVRDASQYGNNDSIRNGFVARIEGFDVVESLDLTQYEVMAYHKSAAAYGISKLLEKDEQREASKKRTFCSLDARYGFKETRGGSLIWFGNETA